jgi:hypothetical protein
MARWGEDSALRDSGRNGESILARVEVLLVVLAATMGEFLGVYGQYTVDLTADEWAYATAVGGVTEVLDTTTLAGFGLGGSKWDGIVLADNVGKLFAAPRDASAVLIIDSVTNTTDNTTLGGLGSDIDKWLGITYAGCVGKLFAAPFDADAVLISRPHLQHDRHHNPRRPRVGRQQVGWNHVRSRRGEAVRRAFQRWPGAVLIIDPLSNTTDITTLVGLGSGGNKWLGIAFAVNVGKLFGAPYNAQAVLVIDPVANTTDMTTLVGLGSGGNKWNDMSYADNVGKLFGVPAFADAVLIIDPVANTTDITTLVGFGRLIGTWVGITYAAHVGKLFAAPNDAGAVLIIDPVTNTTDITTLAGLGSGGNKWRGITYADNVGKLFAAPYNTDTVLIVGFAVDILLPFRMVAELTNTIVSMQAAISSMQTAVSSTEAVLVSTQTDMFSMQEALLSSQVSQSSTEVALASTQASLVSTQSSLASMEAALVSTQAELNTVGETVCNQPVCAAGTQAVNGTCVPDCSDLRRRGVACEPFCDADVTPSNDNSEDGGGDGSSVPTWLMVVVVLCAAIAVAGVGVAVQRMRRNQGDQKTHEPPPQQQHTMTMFMNPVHTGFASFSAGEEQNNDFEEPPRAVQLDSELYVQAPINADQGVYSGTDYEAAYSLFRAPADGRAQTTGAPTYSLFPSPDATA